MSKDGKLVTLSVIIVLNIQQLQMLASIFLTTLMSIISNCDQQLRTTGHPPILIARLVRESKPNGKR